MKVPKIEFTPKAHKNIGIEIVKLSEIYKLFDNNSAHFIAKPHRINFHSLLYVTTGHGTHFIDFNTYTISAGSVVFINKNQTHAFDLKNRPQGKLIIFTDHFLDSILTTIKTPIFAPTHLLVSFIPSFSLTNASRDTCDVLLTEIDKEYDQGEPNLVLLQLLFSTLLAKLSIVRPNLFDKHLSESRASTFMRFISLLEHNYKTIRDAKVYAERLNMTYKSLNQICKLATNQTIKQLIDAQVILEAKRKISIEDIRIQQLAYELGFDETTNFVKYFKKNTLLTPSQFKKSMKG
ncbi:helix-turn-helix domain-containing protein [Thalassotalea piscium]